MFARLCLAVLSAAALAACAEDESQPSGPEGPGPGAGEAPPAEVATITVAPRSAMLWALGEQVPFAASVADEGGRELTDVTVTWSSSDGAVATVGTDGLVTATGDGWAVIRASVGAIEGGGDAVVVTPDASPDRTECLACHAPEYLERHSESGRPTTCLQCHEGPTWAFAHAAASGGFELTGAHASLGCASCHWPDGAPRFPGVGQEECVACHQADYDRRHGGSGFPTSCLTCHTTDRWPGATFDHDGSFFPIFSGPMEGEWSGCSTCHTDPDDFTTFTCFDCHEHERSGTDSDHSGVPGYAYDSALCVACHPDGRS